MCGWIWSSVRRDGRYLQQAVGAGLCGRDFASVRRGAVAGRNVFCRFPFRRHAAGRYGFAPAGTVSCGGETYGPAACPTVPLPAERCGGMRRLAAALCQHGVGHLHESADIGALDVIDISVGFGAVFHAHGVDVAHDFVQLGIDLFGRPVQTHRVLAHLKPRRRYAAGIRRLAGRVEEFVLLEDPDGFRSRRHVGAFGHADTTVFHKRCSLFAVQLGPHTP